MKICHAILVLLGCSTLVLGDTLVLRPLPASGLSGSYQDVDVVAATGTRPIGGLSFDLHLTPPTNVLRFVGALGGLVPASGGLQPADAAATNRTGTNIHVIAFNSLRPDSSAGTNRLITLRFLVMGRPGDSCEIGLSNAVLFSTAAFPTNDMPGSTNETPCRPMAVAATGVTFTVPAVASGAISLTELPDALQKGGVYPVKLTGDFQGRPVSAFDVTFRFPTGAVHVVNVEPNDRLVGLTWDRGAMDSGALRLVGVNLGSAALPAGTVDLATLWLDASAGAAATADLHLDVNAMYAGPGLDAVDLNVSNRVRTVAVSSNAAPAAPMWLSQLPTALERNRLYPVHLRASLGPRALSAFDVTLVYPTNAVRIVDVTPDRRELGVAFNPAAADSGAFRILGINASSLWQPAGTADLATVWLDVRQSAPGAIVPLTLQVNALYSSHAVEALCMSVSNRAETAGLTNAFFALTLSPPPGTNVFLNSEFETPVSVQLGGWAPVLLGGSFTADPARAVITGVEPAGLMADGGLILDTNSFAGGFVPFVWSRFSNGEERTNGALPILNVRWKVKGATLQAGDLRLAMSAADGVWNGIDAVSGSTGMPFRIRYSPVDADGDGIPDWWEIRYYGADTGAVAGDDTDKDRMTAWDEYVAGTNPTNRESLLAMGPLLALGTSYEVRWSSVDDRLYALDSSTNLAAGFGAVAASNIPGRAPTNTFTITNAPASPPLFYRVRVEP